VSNLSPVVKTFDCGHGRKLTVTALRSLPGVAFVTLSDRERNYDLLAWRDNPSITLTCEGQLAECCLHTATGLTDPAKFGQLLCAAHPKLVASEWRRALVREFCSVAVPIDCDRAIRIE